ncbi:MAG TPA: amino acid ABC transporter permease [Bacillota bacterium]|nr:amino acid ABC transporter permease [Bacillota bacterium]
MAALWSSVVEWFSDFGNDFYRNFIVDERYLWILNGLKNTLLMTIFASLIGIAIGLCLSIIRVLKRSGAKIGFLNKLAGAYITAIRGTPVMIQILIINFVIFSSVRVSKLLVASLAFGINSGAYVAEIFRAGIESVDSGQMEAARSLGLSYGRSMRFVVLPQAVRNVLPALFNEFITLLKETSISGYIAFTDLTRSGENIRSITYSAQPLMMVALIYLIVVMLMTRILRMMERRLHRSDRNQTSL